jgi:NAD(P)-dependent dehydrogenase (short-subunit alcohol dehydrogenase family)
LAQALALTIPSYSYETFATAFSSIRDKWPESAVRVAVFNAASGVWKNFLSVTEADVQTSVDTNIVAAFGFSREAILAFQKNDEDSLGKKGTLIFTGATAATRGNKTTSAFAAGKFGLRALSQSLAKEFGAQDIHVCSELLRCCLNRADLPSPRSPTYVRLVTSSFRCSALLTALPGYHRRRYVLPFPCTHSV